MTSFDEHTPTDLVRLMEGRSTAEHERQLRGLLRTVVTSAPVGIALLDPDLRFVMVNEALAEINGLPPEAHVGRTIREVVPDVAEAVEVPFRRVLETGEPLLGLPIEGETPAQPGLRRSWSEDVYRLEVEGDMLGVAAIVTETTDERRAEQRVRRIIDALGSFVGLLSLDGIVLEANEHALAAAALPAEEVVGRPFWDTYWWSHDPAAQRRLRDSVAAAAAGQPVRYDAVVRVAGGRLVTIDFQLLPLVEEGQITGLVPSGVDVSTRRAAANRLRALGDLAQALAVAETTQAAASAVLDHMPAALDADFANLALVDDERRAVRFFHPPALPSEVADRYALSPLTSATPLTDAVRTGRLVTVRSLDDYRARYPDLVEDTIASGLVATASVPLTADDRVIGAVGLGWSQPLGDDDTLLPRLQVIAELTAQTLRRCQSADARAELVDELRRRLLPVHLDHDHLDVAARYRPAGRSLGFGGDWYDVMPLPGDRLTLVVGDVAGHGIGAASRMAVLRTATNTVIRMGVPCSEVFDATEPLVADLGQAFLGTASLAEIDPTAGTVTYVSAGHPPMLLARPGAGVTLLAEANRGVLGMGARGGVSATEAMPSGSVLVAFTDGLIESRREHPDLAIARLAETLQPLIDRGETVDAIADAALESAGDATTLTDDVALLVVRCR